MNRIHDSDFAMLCEVDRICKKHDIKYFLHGGTVLGAIRHKDFIPWDDDVDVSFLRSEYERFLEVFETEADPRFKLLRFEKYNEFFDFMVKVADTSVTYEGTTFGAEDYYSGRFSHPTMDLFVFDIKKSDFQLTRLKFLYGLALGHRPYVNYRHFKGMMKVAAFLISRIGALIPFKTIAAKYMKVQTAGGICGLDRSGEDPVIFISNEQQNPRYWGLTFFGDCILHGSDIGTIRGKEFPIPRDYDKWLSGFYGDYMSLPPEEKRVPQHLRTIVGE